MCLGVNVHKCKCVKVWLLSGLPLFYTFPPTHIYTFLSFSLPGKKQGIAEQEFSVFPEAAEQRVVNEVNGGAPPFVLHSKNGCILDVFQCAGTSKSNHFRCFADITDIPGILEQLVEVAAGFQGIVGVQPIGERVRGIELELENGSGDALADIAAGLSGKGVQPTVQACVFAFFTGFLLLFFCSVF